MTEKDFKASCTACKGRGGISLDMGFLPSVDVPCEACQGTGFQREVRDVQVRGLVLPEIMALTLDEVRKAFCDQEALARPLDMACRVGLGYLVMRQRGHALSGGEVQRLKMAKELCRKPRTRSRSRTLYILDEPTVGQHMADVARLVTVLWQMVEAGNTVLVVAHHPHLLAACDWLLELGPGGGPNGGRLIAAGTPAQVAAGATPVAPYLARVLEGGL
jgi:excinuclease ABC subunit A